MPIPTVGSALLSRDLDSSKFKFSSIVCNSSSPSQNKIPIPTVGSALLSRDLDSLKFKFSCTERDPDPDRRIRISVTRSRLLETLLYKTRSCSKRNVSGQNKLPFPTVGSALLSRGLDSFKFSCKEQDPVPDLRIRTSVARSREYETQVLLRRSRS